MTIALIAALAAGLRVICCGLRNMAGTEPAQDDEMAVDVADSESMDVQEVLDFPGEYVGDEFEVVQHRM